MVLAHRENLDILHQHHLLILLVEDGRVDNLHRVYRVALRHERHSLCHSLGGLYEALTLGVLAQQREYLAIVVGELLDALHIVVILAAIVYYLVLHFYLSFLIALLFYNHFTRSSPS